MEKGKVFFLGSEFPEKCMCTAVHYPMRLDMGAEAWNSRTQFAEAGES